MRRCGCIAKVGDIFSLCFTEAFDTQVRAMHSSGTALAKKYLALGALLETAFMVIGEFYSFCNE